MFAGKTVRARFSGAAAVLALILGNASLSAQAQAQSIFFDWGSNETVNDSGREIVNFEDKARPGELIVSFGDRRVFLIVAPGKALSYPIAVPREKSKWAGVTSVSQKRVSPSWTPTPEMMIENPRLPPWVPGGHPMNPLGTHALYLGSSAYRIHGTDAPWTIGTAASKGCVRMYNKDVQDLYPRVPVGTKVTVTYNTYKFSAVDSESAKGILASLDKGKKIAPAGDVAAAAEQATKKWRGDDSGDSAPVHKAAQQDEGDEKNRNPAADPDASAKPEKHQSASRHDADPARDATVDLDDREAAAAQAAAERRMKHKDAVETGSVEHDKQKPSDKAEAKDKADVNDKAEVKDKPAARKPANEDASVIAKRALAAAERAAAAAERAADAAERASVAAVKASSGKVPASEAKSSGETSSMSGWPVVKSASASGSSSGSASDAAPMSAWPVVKSATP